MRISRGETFNEASLRAEDGCALAGALSTRGFHPASPRKTKTKNTWGLLNRSIDRQCSWPAWVRAHGSGLVSALEVQHHSKRKRKGKHVINAPDNYQDIGYTDIPVIVYIISSIVSLQNAVSDKILTFCDLGSDERGGEKGKHKRIPTHTLGE